MLVPKALNARSSIEVIVFLHGFTEDRGRPYAGWRELVDPKPSTAGLEDVLKERLPRLRQGIDGRRRPRSATSRSTRWSSSSRRATGRSS